MTSTFSFAGVADLGATPAFHRAIARARRSAEPGAITPEHLLLAVIESSGLARRSLQLLGADLASLRAGLAAGGAAGLAGDLQLRQICIDASQEARHLGHYQVDAIHLLLAVLYNRERPAAVALDRAGVTLVGLRQQLLQGRRRWQWKGPGFYFDQIRPHVRPSPAFLVPLGLWVGAGLWLWFSPPEFYVRPLTMLFVICGWVVSLCLHEFGHAAAAYLGGDEGARAAGYLTLNPLRYANPLFSIVLPIIFLIAGGLGLPGGAVYVNLAALRSSRWERIVAASGPLATAIFGLLVAMPFWLPWEDWWLNDGNWYFWPALAMLGFLQVSALLFNLLPVPPLDGFGILAPSLPLDLRQRLRGVSNLFMIVLFTLLWHNNVIADSFWNGVFDLTQLLGVPGWLLSEGFGQFRGM
jgi:Zn-dependent protease